MDNNWHFTQNNKTTVIVDASFCHKTGSAGFAVWVAGDTGRFKHSGTFKTPPATSEDAEFKAILIGAWIAAHKMQSTDILIQSDCKGALNRFVNPRNGPCDDLKLFYRDLPDGVHFKTKHVKGHTTKQDKRSWVNRWCDKHAKHEMRKQRGK